MMKYGENKLSDLTKRLEALSPEQRELLEARLKQEGIDLDMDLKDLKKNNFPSIEPVERKEYYPLSSVQKRLFLLNQYEGTGTVYNVPMIRTVDSNLKKEKLERIFNCLLRRHEAFRTSFEWVDGEPVQRIHQEIDFKIEYCVQNKNTGEQEAPSPEAAIRSFIRPFELIKPPLFRVGFIESLDERSVIMMDMHHILSDQASKRILWNDFIKISGGENIPELKIQYKDFSEWCNREGVLSALRQQEEYWLKELSGELPVLHLPTDYLRPEKKSFEGDAISFRIDPETTERLKFLTSEENSTLFTVLLAIYYVFLSKISRQQDITVGTPTIGRRFSGLEHVIGMFVNTIVFRTYVDDEKSFREFVRQVKQSTLMSFENQDYPFEMLVSRTGKKREVDRNPLFDVFYTFTYPEVEHIGEDISVDNDDTVSEIAESLGGGNFSMFDMFLFGAEWGGELILGITYSTRLFKRETIERFILYFKEITSLVAGKGEIKIADIRVSHSLGTARTEVFQKEDKDFEF